MMLRLAVFVGLVASATADLRMASQPKRAWKVKDRTSVKFVPRTALYMEPSTFNYKGLQRQRDGGGYDQFLRSNIDNEQDKRNFYDEAGRDHLPFRSYESSMTDANEATVRREIPADAPGPAITATPGTPFIVPLRWNNPHAAELEVNIWIMENKYVVPIAKPMCSGEGRQDQVFEFTVPTDFNQLGSKVPGFKGCKNVGDCVLQIYAHSVESRMYSMGTPFIVEGTVPAATATTESAIKPAGTDPGLTLAPLRPICLPRDSPEVDIKTAEPQYARLISDVYNHAYQNSDYSGYSGQQPQAISRNLQASVILKMVPANRGELGRALLRQTNPQAYNFQRATLKQADRVIRKYESITNKIISRIDDDFKTGGDTTLSQNQQLANCFLCAEVGSVTTRRQKTNTYVPSFNIPQEFMATAKAQVPDKYSNLIQELPDGSGVLQIYVAALEMMNDRFAKGSKDYQLHYLPPPMKTTTTTMADAVEFKKRDANGRRDRGEYAAKTAAAAGPTQLEVPTGLTNNLGMTPSGVDLSEDEAALPDTGAEEIEETPDMDALMSDSNCDDDELWTEDMVCDTGTRMFEMPEELVDLSPATAVSASSAWLLALSVVVAMLL